MKTKKGVVLKKTVTPKKQKKPFVPANKNARNYA